MDDESESPRPGGRAPQVSDSGMIDKTTKRNRFLLDRRCQSAVAYRVLAVLAGIGVLYAVAVYVLLGSSAVRSGSVAETRVLFLAVHGAYFVLGGAILVVTTLLLTHRYAGPAVVMESAVAKMRRGDYDGRLTTRAKDFHKGLTEELRHLRDELSEREELRADLLDRLGRSLDSGELTNARELVEQLRAGPTASTTRAAAGAKAVKTSQV